MMKNYTYNVIRHLLKLSVILKIANILIAKKTTKNISKKYLEINSSIRADSSISQYRIGLNMILLLKFLMKILNYIYVTTLNNTIFILTDKINRQNAMFLKKTIEIVIKIIMSNAWIEPE
jgi:hypothetical protein